MKKIYIGFMAIVILSLLLLSSCTPHKPKYTNADEICYLQSGVGKVKCEVTVVFIQQKEDREAHYTVECRDNGFSQQIREGQIIPC